MPYIDEESRQRLDVGGKAKNPGELNYLITRLVDVYLTDQIPLRYTHINEVIGVLECMKLELYRRIASPYEDEKIMDHGDVYQCISNDKP